MSSIFKALVLIFAVFLQATLSTSTKSGSIDDFEPGAIEALRKWVRKNGGCAINLCFALDGSASVTAEEFKTAKTIVRAIAKAVSVNGKSRLAAVQYAAANTAISPLTLNGTNFLRELNGGRRSSDKERFMSGGILYCADQIREFPDGKNKLIVLGSGRDSGSFNPVERSDTFRELGGEVFVVGIGKTDTCFLLQIVNEKNKNFLPIGSKGSGFEMLRVAVNTVSGLCGIDKKSLKDFPALSNISTTQAKPAKPPMCS